MQRTFFRVVSTDPPTERDFMSLEALGVPLIVPQPEKAEMWRGVSVFATLSQARKVARSYPGKGQFIAILEFDDAGQLYVRRTGSGRGLHTVWGRSAIMLASVVAVVHISMSTDEQSALDPLE